MRRFWPVILLGFITFTIVLANYEPGTWLTGWDNLHPEFNFSLNLNRSVFAVWQEYQGLGLLGGMGHASDIFRQFSLYILSFIFDIRILRYFYTFLMLFIGPVGTYFLVKYLLHYKEDKGKNRLAAFAGGLFYLLNLSTVQIFYVPFEVFVTHYGFLPWLLYFFISFLDKGEKRNFILLFIFSVFSLTQGYVPTVFLVYILALFILFLGKIIIERKAVLIKRFALACLLVFLVNAFWLLPFLYFTVTNSGVVGKAYENFMATEDIYLRNKEFGSFVDVAILKGFWFKFVDMDLNRDFYYMAHPWRLHLSNPFILTAGYAFFGIILAGAFYQLKSKNKNVLALTALFIFSIAMLANDTFPLSNLMDFLRDKIPLFSQIFRVPFTKFANLAALSYAVFFTFGIRLILEIHLKAAKHFDRIVIITVSGLLLVFALPLWKGYLFYDMDRLKIPPEYFRVFDYLRTKDPNARMANFPQFTYWGWNHYLWGNRGSGFLWYGINQSILDRAFDGYSQENENYYWELSNALYSESVNKFDSVLKKYQIKYILVDRNVTTSSYAKVLFIDKLEDILNKLPDVRFAANFGKISIYEVTYPSVDNYVFSDQELPVINSYAWNNYDRAYEDFGNYISSDSQMSVYYPFRSLFTGRLQEELEFGVEDKGNKFVFKTRIPKDLAGKTLILPQINDKELTEYNRESLEGMKAVPPRVYLDNEMMESTVSAETRIILNYINKGELRIEIPKIYGYYSYDSKNQDLIKNTPVKNCDKFNDGLQKRESILTDKDQYYRLTSVGSSNCIDLDLANLSQNIGYLAKIDSKYIEGKANLFSVINKNSKRFDLETYLPKNLTATSSFYIIPPKENFGQGYTLHFDNISIGRVRTVNELGRITVNPIPYDYLTGIKILDSQIPLKKDNKTDGTSLSVSHLNTGLYKVVIPVDKNSQLPTTLILSQGYHEGWKAYAINSKHKTVNRLILELFPFWFGEEIKDHVLVNNWENGWKIGSLSLADSRLPDKNLPTTKDQSLTTIIIVYLPQYLEYIGFGLLLLIPVILWRYPKSFDQPHSG